MKCICGSGHDSELHEQAVNKARIGSLGSDRIADRIGLRIGSDRIGSDWYFRFGTEELFEKSCFYATCGSEHEISEQESNL